MSLMTLMDSVCDVYRPTIGQDSAGGTTQDPFVKVNASPLPCTFQENSINSADLYGQKQTVTNDVLYLPFDPGTVVNDQIRVTDRLGKVVYLLSRGEAQPARRYRLWSVDVEKIQTPTSQA